MTSRKRIGVADNLGDIAHPKRERVDDPDKAIHYGEAAQDTFKVQIPWMPETKTVYGREMRFLASPDPVYPNILHVLVIGAPSSKGSYKVDRVETEGTFTLSDAIAICGEAHKVVAPQVAPRRLQRITVDLLDCGDGKIVTGSRSKR